MLIKRRHFLKSGSLAAAGTLLVPKFLKALDLEGMANPLAGNRVLVVIQLSGGNDGLNTVIPVRNDIYYQQRPRIAVKNTDALQLTDEAGLHPSLKGFWELYNSGDMAILNNVGYPNPDRSHFRSMDIWQTASPAKEYWETGWLGRYLDATCADCAKPTQVVELDDVLSLALKGEHHKGLAFQDPTRLYNTSSSPFFKKLAQDHHDGEEPLADYLYKTMADTLQSADTIFAASKQHKSTYTYPNTGLAKNLQTISTLVNSDLNTSVYYVSLGSFDTHINQEAQQTRLLTELNDAVLAFVNDLKANNKFNDVLVVTFSEFGRRVTQNASGGTDHGTANNMFLIGGGLKKKGLLNEMPNLTDLDNGDLKFRVDFRQVYATILNNWLQTPAERILKENYAMLDFV